MDKSRFSMLLLEPGEIYFEDFSCTINNEASTKSIHAMYGRLKLCSKSLVFEPRDWHLPLIKLYFKDCVQISIVPTIPGETKNVLEINMKAYAEMLEDNILAPYKFKYELKDFFIFLDFASAEECLGQMQQLQRASTLHAPEHNSMVATILHSRYMRMVFDPVMMDDFTEKIIYELQVERVTPLVRHQGKLAVTATTLYFQPFSNVQNCAVLKLKMVDIKRIYKRRFLLRQVGLEIYCHENNSTPHMYLTFQSKKERDTVYDYLVSSDNVSLEKVMVEEMTMQWQNGVVSNFDYLTYLNCLADRSKNDLTQYPVFPWVVADYTSETLDLDNIEAFRDLSKPIGALNSERLNKLLERYSEMSEPRFLYGSHYSAPGLVLFYLVRKYPQYMLCLQNGRFDHPDRMFNSVKDVFNNCLSNMSDFKELVPEFYDVTDKGDFLVNNYEIDFGERHDGRKVNDVALPPWASSPEDFVRKLRNALESDCVSRYLHLWIDLIFGYKQRGEEAIKANNVFHHVCYEGSVDLDRIYDMNDRHALEVQIMEFGQVPKQLFTKPHVRRLTHEIVKSLSFCNDNEYLLQCVDTLCLHKEEVSCVIQQGSRVISVGKDGALKVYDSEQRKQIRSVALCSTPLSSCVKINENLVAAGSWDNEIYIYDVEYGRVVESFRAHDDSVSQLLWIDEEKLLISGGWDCVVRVWGDICLVRQPLRALQAEFDHDGKITALTYRRRHQDIDIITGTGDGDVYIWNYTTKVLLNKFTVHNTPVTDASFMQSGDRVVTVSEGGDMTVTDINVLHSVYQKQFSEAMVSICWDEGHRLWLGSSSGKLLLFNMVNASQIYEQDVHTGVKPNEVFHKANQFTDAITSIHVAGDSKMIATASRDRSVKLWTLVPKS